MKKNNPEFTSYPAALPPPSIIIDTREKTPLEFQHLNAVRGTLTTGDYSLKGFLDSFIVERKTIADAVASLTRGRDRLFRELARMRGAKFARLLIVGGSAEMREVMKRRKVNIESIVGSLAWINANLVPVVKAPSAYKAAQVVERWAYYFYAGAARPFGKVDVPSWARQDIIPNGKELA